MHKSEPRPPAANAKRKGKLEIRQNKTLLATQQRLWVLVTGVGWGREAVYNVHTYIYVVACVCMQAHPPYLLVGPVAQVEWDLELAEAGQRILQQNLLGNKRLSSSSSSSATLINQVGKE